MVRTLISLPETDKAWLDRTARQRGVAASSLVREALGEYRKKAEQDPEAFGRLQAAVIGLWRHGDSAAYVRRLRDEWER